MDRGIITRRNAMQWIGKAHAPKRLGEWRTAASAQGHPLLSAVTGKDNVLLRTYTPADLVVQELQVIDPGVGGDGLLNPVLPSVGRMQHDVAAHQPTFGSADKADAREIGLR